MREAILAAAEELLSTYSFNAVPARDSVAYHFKTPVRHRTTIGASAQGEGRS